MSARLAEHVLEVLRSTYGLQISSVRAEDEHKAACLLAELVGCDLEG